MNYFMFIDESGDLGSQSKSLVLAALIVKDTLPLDRIIKNMRRNKFKKQLQGVKEIKANWSSPELVKYSLEKLNTVPDVKVLYIILEKARCHSKFLLNDKHKLYNYAVGKLAEHVIFENADLTVRIDYSKRKQVLRDDFDNYFERKLNEHSRLTKVEIHHSYSHAWSDLQFADILAWSMFQEAEHKNSEYIDILTIDKEIYPVWN